MLERLAPNPLSWATVAVVAVGMVFVGWVIGANAAAADGDDNRVDVTTPLVRGEDLFAWIDVPDGDRMYRCLILADNIDEDYRDSPKVAALWCERRNQ